VKWFRKAAVQGEPMAQFNMGWMYENGTGVQKNASKALEWYRKASFSGHIEAPSFVAILYDAGNGVKMDKIAAYAWWFIGAKLGDEAPLNNLDFLETKLTAQQIQSAKYLAAQLEKEMATGKP
jgi:TPR repeat protein